MNVLQLNCKHDDDDHGVYEYRYGRVYADQFIFGGAYQTGCVYTMDQARELRDWLDNVIKEHDDGHE